jgi:hypothetical protein
MVMKKVGLAGAAAALVCLASSNADADVIGGIDFPDGVVSFADQVHSYTAGTNVSGNWLNSSYAVGVPDYNAAAATGAVSLGIGGELILRFIDNSLTTSGNNTPDIHVFEIGGNIERFNLSISTDGLAWIDLGDVLGQPTSVDIDSKAGVIAGTKYTWVRLLDVAPNQSGSPFGEADIDAVGAISSAPPPPPVPEPATLSLLGLGLAGLGLARRRSRS